MDITAALAADLDALAEATGDEAGIDVRAALDELCRTGDVAVRSLLGLTLAVDHLAGRVTLTVLQPGAKWTVVASSLHLAVSQLVGGQPRSTLTLFAGLPGAFDVLAGDLERLYGQDGTAIVRDAHLRLPPDSDRHSVAELSVVNQALGILVAHGWIPDDARDELRRRATRDGIDLPGAARRLVHTVSRGRGCD